MILIILVNVIISKKQTQPQNYRCLDFSCYNYHNFFSFLQFSDKGMSDSKNKQIKKKSKTGYYKNLSCPEKESNSQRL